jgi:hypothetical protein
MPNEKSLVMKGDRIRTPNTEVWKRFLALLQSDHDLAGVEYGGISRELLAFPSSRGCWGPEQRGRVGSEVLKDRPRQFRGRGLLSQLTAVVSPPQDEIVRERQLECLHRCLQPVAPVNRAFLLASYWHKGAKKIRNKNVMANSFVDLRVRAFRLQRELARTFRASSSTESEGFRLKWDECPILLPYGRGRCWKHFRNRDQINIGECCAKRVA